MLLAKALRFTRPVVGRSRPIPSDEIVDPPSYDEFYVVKDYTRNPFYGSLLHLKRPGKKKLDDPFTEHFEKRDWAWREKYPNQVLEMAFPPSLFFFFAFFIPAHLLWFFYWETRWRSYYVNPLGYDNCKAVEG